MTDQGETGFLSKVSNAVEGEGFEDRMNLAKLGATYELHMVDKQIAMLKTGQEVGRTSGDFGYSEIGEVIVLDVLEANVEIGKLLEKKKAIDARLTEYLDPNDGMNGFRNHEDMDDDVSTGREILQRLRDERVRVQAEKERAERKKKFILD